MKASVQKWGNSLAVRIPRAFAVEAGLSQDTPVEITLEDGKVVVARAAEQASLLDELLSGVTDENVHGEVDTGAPVGSEAW